MKIVSFKVARALKEAGYPQGESYASYLENIEGEGYLMDKDSYEYSAPSYFEAWLWLWRERKECIDIISAHNHDALVHINGELKGFNDPEEAIANAIDYLVDNNLIQ